MAVSQLTESAPDMLGDVLDPLLSSLMQHVSDGVLIVDGDLNVLSVNATAAEILRITARTDLGQPLDRLLRAGADTTPGEVWANIRSAVSHGEMLACDRICLGSVAGERHNSVNLKVAPVEPGVHGAKALILIQDCTGTDLTRKRERELQRKEFDLSQALKSSRQGVWEWNAQQNLFSASAEWCELFGYADTDVGKNIDYIAELVHPDDIGATRSTLIKALKGEIEYYETQQRIRHKDGHFLHCLVRGRVVERDGQGRAIRMAGTHTDIAELRNTQDALRESNTRLNIALENAQQGIFEWYPETDAFSQHGSLRYGDDSLFSSPIVSGEQLKGITHPDDLPKVEKAISAYLRGDTSIYSVEHRVRFANGNYRTFLVRGQAMERADDGRVTRILGTHTDISDLKVHAQRLDLALRNGRQGMWEWRPIADTIEFSDSWHALYGYAKGEINNVRTDVSELIHPDDFPTARNALIGLLTGRRNDYSVEYRFRCADGHYLWVMERCAVIDRDANGRATLVVGTHVDISEQKSVEHDLRESRHFLKLVLDALPDRVYWKDTQGRYLGANHQCVIDAGFTETNQLVGLTDEQLSWRKDAATYRAEDDEIIRSSKPKLALERSLVHADGTRHLFETNKVPLIDESGKTIGILGISHEITERRQRERQLEKLAESITGGDGGRLLDALVKGAVELSGANTAFISKLDDSGGATVISTFPQTDALDGVSYMVADTPCANALGEDIYIYRDNVQAAYPEDKTLAGMGIVSYVGKCLLDTQNKAIGIIALLDTKPLQNANYATSVLDILAATASTELQREQREIALRESEERYRTTYDNVPVMICTLDEAGTITDVNNAWINATGFPAEETAGTKLVDYFTPSSQNNYLELSPISTESQRAGNETLEFICKDGSIIKVAHSATRTVSSDGVAATITVLEDVTNQIIAEQQLRLAATAFETHEALIIRDAQRRILRVNNAFKKITGYSDEDVIGKSPEDLDDPERGTQDETEIWKSADQLGEWDGEWINYRADGSTYSAWRTITAVRDDHGDITHYVENFTDISELKQALEDAERLALYDPLTQLPNRRYLTEQLESNISLSRRHRTTGALLFIDLDQFKTINDSLGHAIGDVLLVHVARRLTRLMRQEDTIARLGGDEFVVVLPELGSEPRKCIDHARRVADKIHIELGKPYEVENHELHITPTIGITLFPEDGKSVDEILQEADSAMYQGKAAGRNVTKFFHPSMQSEAQTRLDLERDLRTAAERDELELYFQPQYNTDGEIFAAEALLRWHHPTRGFVPPDLFIPIAEESGLIIDIGHWVFARAVDCLRRWERADSMFLNHLAINVSSRQFRSPHFVGEVIRSLVSAGVPAQHVVIEVTERTVIENFDETARKMEELRDIGIRFSVDDFGVGYSSLSYLSRLPLDQLKIDRSFITNVLHDPSDAVIAETIIGMGRNLHLQTIAEGVENEPQLNFLRDQGCDGFQGYLFSKPVPENEFLELDRKWRIAD